MCSVGWAREQLIDTNSHSHDHFFSVPFVVLKVLWSKFVGVDLNFSVWHT
jgi:hypothetical protein